MFRFAFVFSLFCLFTGWVLASSAVADVTAARIELVTIETAGGRHEFKTEMADTPELRRRGLMFRHRLPQDRGMLFTWGYMQPIRMWMRNTNISLDMIFLDTSGTVQQIERNTKPHSLDIVASREPMWAVLEVVAGTADRIGLKVGDKVRHSLFETN